MTDADRYDVLCQRRSEADERFVYGIASTHTYCRPSCTAPTPAATHVRYFDTAVAASEAGFHPCLRCQPRHEPAFVMSASQWRDAEIAVSYTLADSSLGAVLLAATSQGVCALSLGDDADALVGELLQRFPKARQLADDPELERLIARVIAALNDPARGLCLPLHLCGTAFQQRVWRALCDIAPGTTATYSQVAVAIGAPTSARAVATACASNTVAIAIPCHRVIRSDGSLSGYRWGVQRKRALLDGEQPALALP